MKLTKILPGDIVLCYIIQEFQTMWMSNPNKPCSIVTILKISDIAVLGRSCVITVEYGELFSYHSEKYNVIRAKELTL